MLHEQSDLKRSKALLRVKLGECFEVIWPVDEESCIHSHVVYGVEKAVDGVESKELPPHAFVLGASHHVGRHYSSDSSPTKGPLAPLGLGQLLLEQLVFLFRSGLGSH